MIIPTGSVHDARVTGGAIREIACQRCRRPFFFILRRIGKGRAKADFFIGMKSAESRAAGKAHADLQKKLSRDLDPVPCPNCGLYPPEMVVASRSRLYPWKKLIGFWAIAHFGGGYLLFRLLPSAPSPTFYLPGLLTIGYLLFRRFTFDPNSSSAAADRVRKRVATPSFTTLDSARSAMAKAAG